MRYIARAPSEKPAINANRQPDLQHNLCIRMQDNQLYISPAGKDKSKPLGRVLDGGCGTGIWAIEFGTF